LSIVLVVIRNIADMLTVYVDVDLT
jgi:hypothetical protein